VYALLFGGVCIGFAPILVRLADTGPVASAFWRLCLAAPLLWLMVVFRQWRAADNTSERRLAPAHPGQSWRHNVAPLLAGVFFAADLGTWHFSIRDTTVANATLLANCAPLLVTLYALVVERRSPPRSYYLALALALLGTVALVGPNFEQRGHQLRGDVLGLVAAVFYTAYMLAVKHARTRVDTLRLMAVSTSISALVLLPIALFIAGSAQQAFWPMGWHGWLALLGLALVTQILGQGLIAYALAHLSAALSTTGLLIQPVVAAVAAWIIFGEALGAWQLLGAPVLLLGIYLARRSDV
jgi:drug/metabolite transporter (DMT)-like permease